MASPMRDPGSLREAAALKYLLYGAALCTSDLAAEPRCRTLRRECSLVTPEYEMKWDQIAGRSEQPDYRASDRLVGFASENGLAIHGHTVW